MANQDAATGRFVVGNFAAGKHLARSARGLRMKQQGTRRRVRRELREGSRAWLERLIVAVESRVSAYRAYLDHVGGPISDRGQPRRCLERLDRDEERLIRLYVLLEGRHQPEEDLLAVLARPEEAGH